MHDIPQRGRVTRYGERIDPSSNAALLHRDERRDDRVDSSAEDLRALAIHAYAVGHRVPPCGTRAVADKTMKR
ncbi:hypothetical protein WK39_30015 [Burkholderia cepacia]|uniref:hypothetical protein n=1 Tax=Burkholderia cepacia TaxID=292 RepID=UPI00075B5E1D|nr:hypothetical protein [Burkholderia cepacia]KVS49942.1 hypothetical protein WK39_30015 [Burkholderia cepacia]KVS66137.1 hypothetical protein WK40_11350 [Burkholderia cepacia]RQT86832.1 hypothetical protein DF023_06670 [Burkholderia cepacia]RQT92820.1 hypothetical protein DF022_36865 [Burkholderia cepacia]RQZ83396.1 hypothetical protein DF056_06250 [Burkholderia cepacia]